MLGVLVIFAAVGVLRLAYWQVVMGPDLSVRAMGQIQKTADVPAVRGDILDRNGRVLATTAYRDTLAAFPKAIGDKARQTIVDGVGEILGLDEAARTRLAQTTLDARLEYAVIARELTEDQSRQMRAFIDRQRLGGLKLLELLPHAVRIYPNPGGQPGTSLASQLLGFVQGSTGTGHYGIEGHYDAVLAGTPTRVAVARDGGGTLESSELVLDPGVDGRDIRLSIDASLQLQLEKELFLAWNADRAQRVSGIVMDPDNGEILAWASVPGYDANDIAATDASLFQDPNVSQVYEPGSVMKMLTATAALETKAVTPDSRIMDSSSIRFGPDTVRNADHQGMGRIPFRDVIAYSRNVGVVQGRQATGPEHGQGVAGALSDVAAAGHRGAHGRGRAGRGRGHRRRPREAPWAPIDLANRSFGQAVAVTLVQLATAFAPMADGGMRVQPHFLVAIGDDPQPVAAARAGHEEEDREAGALAADARHGWRLVLRAGLAHPALRGGRQDRHRADLAREGGPLRPEHVQLHVRGLRRRRRARGRGRGAHPRGGPVHQASGRPAPQDHLVRAVPTRREGGHHEPRHPAFVGPRTLGSRRRAATPSTSSAPAGSGGT